jgi:hypothetical protein
MPGQEGGRTVLAGATTGGDLQSVAKVIQAPCALVDGVADVPLGYGVADADVHDLVPNIWGPGKSYR